VSEKVASGDSLPESWKVQIPVFEGPLDLLLHLVRVNEVEITDIPVTLICDQFHEYLRLMEELDLDVAAEYLYEAALLIQIKSKMLLPQRGSRDGEEAEDPRQELVERLLEYRKIKQASQSLAEVHGVRRGIWTRSPGPSEVDQEAELDLGDISMFDLLGALKTVLFRYEHLHPDSLLLHRESFGVRDQFRRLLEMLEMGRPLDLLADLRSRSCRSEVVAAFLAVLELARLRLVKLHQTRGGELLLQRTERELGAEDMETIRE